MPMWVPWPRHLSRSKAPKGHKKALLQISLERIHNSN